MTVDDADRGEKRMTSHRRRFLQGVGATGAAGVLAGCLGDDDEPEADDADDTEPADDDDDEPDPDPANFAVSDLDPAEASVTRGEEIDVSATIENTGDEEGTQDVTLEIDGDEHGSTEVSLDGGDSESVSFPVDTADLAIGEFSHVIATEDEEQSDTLELEPLLEDPDPLLSFAENVRLATGTSTLTGTLENPYDVAIEDGEVDGELPDGWELVDESGTEFDAIAAGESQPVSWEFEIPEDADGEYELEAAVSYSAIGEDATVPSTVNVNVFVPMSAPFGMDCGGTHTDETVTIDGLEFLPTPEQSQAIELDGENRPLEADEIWWPDALTIEPEPNESPGALAPWGEDRPIADEEGVGANPDIEGTEHDSLYWTEHWVGGELNYHFGIENGVYEVTLHFAEIWSDEEGGRVIDAYVDGETVFEGLDLIADYGPDTAIVYSHVTEVDDNDLHVRLEAGAPKISGIEIREFEGPPEEGSVGYWTFDEEHVDGETVVDASGNGHDGTIHGGVTTGLDAPVGGAAEFDGEEGSTILVDDDEQLDPPEYTVSVWIQTDGTGDWSALVGKDESFWCGTLEDTGNPRLDPHDDFDMGETIAAETTVEDGDWHHVVYQHAPSEDASRIYIDNELAVTGEGVTESGTSDSPLGIASKSDVADWLTGALADVRLYDRPLDSGEVASLYREGDVPDAE